MGFWNFISKGVDVEKKRVGGETTAGATAISVMTEEAPVPQSNMFELSFGSQQPQQSMHSFGSVLGGANLSSRNILITTPRTTADTSNIVEHLKTGEACIVCVDGLAAELAQRRIDFLSGVVRALNGTLKQLDAGKYVLTPNGVGVKS